MENNVSNYFPNVLAVQDISRNLTKKGSNFQQTLKTFLVLSFIEYALDVILCGTAFNLCLQFQMVETGNRDFLEYNIYLTRGWGPNMVSKVQAGCCIARYKFLTALTSSNRHLESVPRLAPLFYTRMRRRTSSLDVNKRLAMGDQNGTAFSVALLELIQGM